MNARPALVYTVLRLLAFLVPFGIMMLFPIFREYYWLAAIFAALIGLSLSMLFLRRPLDEVSSALAARRARAKTGDDASAAASPEAGRRELTDEEIEDAAAEASFPTADTAASPPDGEPQR